MKAKAIFTIAVMFVLAITVNSYAQRMQGMGRG